MKKLFSSVLVVFFLTACVSTGTPQDASQAEIQMAEMMGITVEELRNQTPEEHMQMMQNMMQQNPQEQGTSGDQALYDSLSPGAQALYYKQSKALTQPVPERLVELDQKVIGCFGPSTIAAMLPEDENLGGQCCGALTNIDAYHMQLEALERFIVKNGGRDVIPADPYDVSVTQAQSLLEEENTIVLSAEQQETFDVATNASHHGGPCCCKCWKWYMMSGLAKKMITEYDWNAQQIAEMWDLSSSCGHSEDTNMHLHYS